MHLQVHLVQCLLHMVHERSRHLHQAFPMPEQRTYRTLPAPAGTRRAIVPPNAKTVTTGSPTRRSVAPVHSSRAVHSPDTPQNHAPPKSGTVVSSTRPLTP